MKEHCLDIQEQAENMVEQLAKQLMAVEGISEDLKSYDQMEWVRRMNSLRNRVDEVVLTEVVYRYNRLPVQISKAYKIQGWDNEFG